MDAHTTNDRTNFLTVNGVHQNNCVGAKLSQRTWLHNFLTRTSDKATYFSRIDIDDMRNNRAARIDDVQECYRLRPRAPHDDVSSVNALLLDITRPFCNTRAKRRPNSLTQGCRPGFVRGVVLQGAIMCCHRGLDGEELVSKSLSHVSRLEPEFGEERNKRFLSKI